MTHHHLLRSFTLATAVLAVSGLSHREAAAFVSLTNNNAHTSIGTDFKVNTNDFPTGGTFHNVLLDATAQWEAGSGELIRGASYGLDHAHFTGITISGDFTNHIHRGGLPDGVLGRATWWRSPGAAHMAECDININDDPTDNNGNSLLWSAQTPAADGRVSLQMTALHEMGHCVGMDHDDSHGNLMATSQTISDDGPWIAESFLFRAPEDERRFVRTIHGDASTGQDLALTTFTCCNASGAQTNFDVDVTSFNAGTDEVTASFTFGYLNLGSATQTVKVTFRLIPESAPTWPAGWDPAVFDPLVIDDIVFILGANDPHEPTKIVTFTHPGDEDYFIGAFIDSDTDVSETSETNNTLVSRCKITPSGGVICD